MLGSYVLFPYFTTYWSLLSVNLREMKVSLWDPLKRVREVSDLLASLFEFIRQELLFHEQRRIEDTPWRDLTFENTRELEVFDAADSGVYALQKAQQICLGQRGEVRKACMPQYRLQQLQLLYYNKDGAS